MTCSHADVRKTFKSKGIYWCKGSELSGILYGALGALRAMAFELIKRLSKKGCCRSHSLPGIGRSLDRWYETQKEPYGQGATKDEVERSFPDCRSLD